MDWRDIDTAPKDGTHILGFNNRGNYSIIFWDTFFGNGWGIPFTSVGPHPFWNGACGSVPTHWMPLVNPFGKTRRNFTITESGREG